MKVKKARVNSPGGKMPERADELTMTKGSRVQLKEKYGSEARRGVVTSVRSLHTQGKVSVAWDDKERSRWRNVKVEVVAVDQLEIEPTVETWTKKIPTGGGQPYWWSNQMRTTWSDPHAPPTPPKPPPLDAASASASTSQPEQADKTKGNRNADTEGKTETDETKKAK